MGQESTSATMSPVGWDVREVKECLGPATETCFVGRHQEIAALHTAFEQAWAGCGGLILLAGEPGVGKTRLVHELAAYASRNEARVLLGHCYEGEGAPPFWPWIQIIRTYIANWSPATLEAELGAAAADIAQFIPEVHQQLPDLPSLPALTPEQARFRFFDGVTTFLKHAGCRRPLVLILDDLHWADSLSLLLLQFLAHALSRARLLVVGTYRDVPLEHQPPLKSLLGELVRIPGYQRLFLQGLSQSEVARLIELTIGVAPAAAVVESLYRQTEGNPFFLTEMVRLLEKERGVATFRHASLPSCLALPQGVRDAIHRRLQSLSAPCHRILALASVIGQAFDLETLASVSHTAPGPLLHLLDRMVAAHVITENRDAPGHYRFAHALIRETLYASLPTAQRVQTHRQVGTLLEVRLGVYAAPYPGGSTAQELASSSGPAWSELAYHFFAAACGGDGAKAIRYAVQAGEQATSLLAYEEAGVQYERALQILAYTQPTDDRRRCQLLLALCGAQAKAGDVLQARDTLFQAATTARHVSAPELLARAALGLETVAVQVGLVDQPLVALLEESLEALGEGDSALRARVLARLAQELYFCASATTRRAILSQEAVAMAQRVGDPSALAAALDSRRLDLWGPGDVQERLAMATETIRLAEMAGDRERTMHCRIDRINDLLELGDLLAVDLEIDAYVQLAEELRQPRYRWYGQTFRIMRLLLEGQFEAGKHLAGETLALGQWVQPHIAANVFNAQMFSLHRELGCLQELEDEIERFVAQSPTLLAWRSALSSLYSELGRVGEARDLFEQLAANDFANLPRDENWLVGMTLLAEVCAFLADTERAATLYDLLLPYAGQHVVIGDASVCNGAVARPLGLLSAVLRRWQEAAQHFEAALAMNLRLGARPYVARTQYEYAAMLLARCQPGDHAQAQKLLDAALCTTQKLGMQGLAARVHALQQQALTRRAPALPSIPQEMSEQAHVFRKDGDYWTLAYQGILCRLKDAKGLHYIAFLLRAPGRTFHALELAALSHPRPHSPVVATAVPDLAEAIPSDLGSVLDPQAKMAYKRRLCELQDEFDEAQQFHDLTRATAIQAEIDALTYELSTAIGLGGRDRKAGSTAERARSAVTKAIKTAVQNIRAHHPALGHHLATHLKTGTFCQYLPDPTQAMCWQAK